MRINPTIAKTNFGYISANAIDTIRNNTEGYYFIDNPYTSVENSEFYIINPVYSPLKEETLKKIQKLTTQASLLKKTIISQSTRLAPDGKTHLTTNTGLEVNSVDNKKAKIFPIRPIRGDVRYAIEVFRNALEYAKEIENMPSASEYVIVGDKLINHGTIYPMNKRFYDNTKTSEENCILEDIYSKTLNVEKEF